MWGVLKNKYIYKKKEVIILDKYFTWADINALKTKKKKVF